VQGVIGVSRRVLDPVGRRRRDSQGQNRIGENPLSGIARGPGEPRSRVGLGTQHASESALRVTPTEREARLRSIPTNRLPVGLARGRIERPGPGQAALCVGGRGEGTAWQRGAPPGSIGKLVSGTKLPIIGGAGPRASGVVTD